MVTRTGMDLCVGGRSGLPPFVFRNSHPPPQPIWASALHADPLAGLLPSEVNQDSEVQTDF